MNILYGWDGRVGREEEQKSKDVYFFFETRAHGIPFMLAENQKRIEKF